MSDSQQHIQVVDNPSQREVVEQYLNQVPADSEISAERIAELRAQIKAQLIAKNAVIIAHYYTDPLIQSLACLLYTSPSPRDAHESRMPSSA